MQVHNCVQSRPTRPACKQGVARRVALVVPLLPALLAGARSSQAAPSLDTSDDLDNPLIQDLLRRTAEKKEERKKERLEDYYRRNYQDYFSFEAGNKRNGLSEDTKRRIQEFLENSKIHQ